MPPLREDPRQRLLQRHPNNPLLTAFDWPYFVNTVFNPGAARLPSGEILLLCRVEDCSGLSHLCAARSPDGVTDWKIDPHPTLLRDLEGHPEELWGIEDPRVVWVPELESYAVTYTCYSQRGPGVSLALTKDFREFERVGQIFPPEDKDAALLPRRVDGRWALIHRPVPKAGRAHIWMSFSPDLRHWGDHTLVLKARRGAWWDAFKIGLSPPLIETPEGWLLFYLGVLTSWNGLVYSFGAALLDLDEPWKVVRRGRPYLLSPQETYQRFGDVPNVVFPCAALHDPPTGRIAIYYGAADTVTALAFTRLDEVLQFLKENPG